MELEAAGFVQAFLFQCCDCYALFFADWRTALEGHGPLVGVKVRGVEIHIRHDQGEYDGQRDVDEIYAFHARLDGVRRFLGNSSLFVSYKWCLIASEISS
jgi:hypothetical protein